MNTQPGRLYRLLVWNLSGALFAAGGLLLILMLANVIGPFRFGALDASQLQHAVGLWIPADGQRPYPPEIARRTEAWRRLLRDEHAVIESDRLRDLLNAHVGLVILPDARSLTAEHAEAIERYLEQGGGVVVCGSIGVRGRGGEWLGYDVMRRLLGVDAIAPLERASSQALAARRRGPLSAGLRPGHTTRLAGEPGVPGLGDPDSELRWAGAGADALAHAAASHRVRRGRGRLAWLGPGPEVVSEANDEDVRALHAALGNALAWVRRRPVHEVADWPGSATFAFEIWKRAKPEAATLDAGARARLEASLQQALDGAAHRGEFVLLELPIRGPGDAWAESVRIHLLERAHEAGGWLATRQEASDWMARRAGLRTSLHALGPNRLLVDVTNELDGELDGAALRLWINRPAGTVAVGAVTLGQALPTLRFERASESAEIELPSLGPRATLSFFVDLDQAGSDEPADVHSG